MYPTPKVKFKSGLTDRRNAATNVQSSQGKVAEEDKTDCHNFQNKDWLAFRVVLEVKILTMSVRFLRNRTIRPEVDQELSGGHKRREPSTPSTSSTSHTSLMCLESPILFLSVAIF